MLIEISALPQNDDVDIGEVINRLSMRIAVAIGEETSYSKWVLWHSIEPGRYADGGSAPARQPRGTHPPQVTIVAYEGRDRYREEVLTLIADALTEGLGLDSGNVAIMWLEVKAGFAYGRGEVVRRPLDELGVRARPVDPLEPIV